MPRPNILFLMSDEHRPDVTAYAGDPVKRQVRPGVDASVRELRRTVAAYYGMIETIDDPRYAPQVAAFRRRRGQLNFGPNADPGYVNAGYGSI